MSLKSRVFISCGQRKNNELTIAKQIAAKLEEMGFDPYIAVEEQCLKGVKENIFKRLEKSEYFLFIDFKRERLYKINGGFVDTGKHRGSLFSHQELAIATFQDYEVLAFQEEGVKKDDGILKFIQANCIQFSERRHLPCIVAEKVMERKWDPTWRNEIVLNRDDNDFQDARVPGGGVAKFYHIKVINHHKDKIARNCIAYVERIKNLENGKTRVLELSELKWKGSRTEGVSIAPKLFRYLDAFNVFYSSPTIVNLGLNPFIVDWQGYIQDYQIRGSGDYEIDYVVFSEDFSPARAKFRLHIGTQIQDVEFQISSMQK